MRSFFITGTDTDVGKTMATAAICAMLRQKGLNSVPVKPVQTGCDRSDEGLTAPDLEFSLASCGMQLGREDRDALCLYRYQAACSPHLAAEIENNPIDPLRIIRAVKTLQARYANLLVEGAGGILVPLTRSYLMLDLMQDLALPVILVSRPGLGAINHTLLSLAALRSRALAVAGVVFCETRKPARDYIEEDNRRAIAALGSVPILGTVPWFPDFDSAGIPPTAFLRAVSEPMSEVVTRLGDFS
ncbi:MAG: dethiobiotin synthase [Pirellulaceae bacterium]